MLFRVVCVQKYLLKILISGYEIREVDKIRCLFFSLSITMDYMARYMHRYICLPSIFNLIKNLDIFYALKRERYGSQQRHS
jgi:hypothetical protein